MDSDPPSEQPAADALEIQTNTDQSTATPSYSALKATTGIYTVAGWLLIASGAFAGVALLSESVISALVIGAVTIVSGIIMLAVGEGIALAVRIEQNTRVMLKVAELLERRTEAGNG